MKKLLIGIAVAAACNQALAEGYVGVGGGMGFVTYDQKAAVSDDDSALSYKVFAGYSFNRNLALEGGYQHFTDFGQTNVGSISELAGYAVYIDLIGTIPMGEQWGLFGRLGLAGTTLEGDIAGTVGTKAHDTGPRLGAGAQFNFGKSFGVRAEWERTFKVGSNDTTGETDIDVVGASLLYRF